MQFFAFLLIAPKLIAPINMGIFNFNGCLDFLPIIVSVEIFFPVIIYWSF